MKDRIIKTVWLVSIVMLPLGISHCGSDPVSQDPAVNQPGTTPGTGGGTQGTSVGTSCSLPNDIANPCTDSKVVKFKCSIRSKYKGGVKQKVEGKCENGKKFEFEIKDGKVVEED